MFERPISHPWWRPAERQTLSRLSCGLIRDEKKEKKRKGEGFSAHQAVPVLHHAFLSAMCNHFYLPARLFLCDIACAWLVCKMWSCVKQGLPGPPGSSGPPGSPGDPGERVSVSEPCMFPVCSVSANVAPVCFIFNAPPPPPKSIRLNQGSSGSSRPSWCWRSARTCWNRPHAACE